MYNDYLQNANTNVSNAIRKRPKVIIARKFWKGAQKYLSFLCTIFRIVKMQEKFGLMYAVVKREIGCERRQENGT